MDAHSRKGQDIPLEKKLAVLSAPGEGLQALADRLQISKNSVWRIRNTASLENKVHNRTTPQQRKKIQESDEPVPILALRYDISESTVRHWQKKSHTGLQHGNKRDHEWHGTKEKPRPRVVTLEMAIAIQERPEPRWLKEKLLDVGHSTVDLWKHRKLSDYFTEAHQSNLIIAPQTTEEKTGIIRQLLELQKEHNLDDIYDWAKIRIPSLTQEKFSLYIRALEEEAGAARELSSLYREFEGAGTHKKLPAKRETNPLHLPVAFRKHAIDMNPNFKAYIDTPARWNSDMTTLLLKIATVTFERMNKNPQELLNFAVGQPDVAARLLKTLADSGGENKKLALDALLTDRVALALMHNLKQRHVIDVFDSLVTNDPAALDALLRKPAMMATIMTMDDLYDYIQKLEQTAGVAAVPLADEAEVFRIA